MAIAGRKVRVTHPLVFAAKMIVSVVNQGLPMRNERVVRCVDHRSKQIDKLMVRIVHEIKSQLERFRPLQCGHVVPCESVGVRKVGLSIGEFIVSRLTHIKTGWIARR